MPQAQTIPRRLKHLRGQLGRTSLDVRVESKRGKGALVDAWAVNEAARNSNRIDKLSLSKARSGSLDDLLQVLLTTRAETILVNGDVPNLLEAASRRNGAEAETARRIIEALTRHAQQYGTKVVYPADFENKATVGRGDTSSRHARRQYAIMRADEADAGESIGLQNERLRSRRHPHHRIQLAAKLAGEKSRDAANDDNDSSESPKRRQRAERANGESGRDANAGGDKDFSTAKPIEGFSAGGACEPFFDTHNNPVPVKFSTDGKKVADVTPPPPILTDFDRSVLEICNRIDAPVSFDQVNDLFVKYPEILERIMKTTKGVVRFGEAPFTEPEAYRKALVNVLVGTDSKKHNWFRHVMAGERKNGTIGGFHLPAAYLQAQKAGEACRLPHSPQTVTEVDHGHIYTSGLRVGENTKPASGFALGLSADQLVEIAAFAFATNPFKSDDKTSAVMLPVELANGYKIQFVIAARKSWLVTTYSDATPQGGPPAAREVLKLTGQHGGPEYLAAAQAAAANGNVADATPQRDNGPNRASDRREQGRATAPAPR